MVHISRHRQHAVHTNHDRQRGVVLIVALIALVVITLITVTTVRNTQMEERMAGASRDRNKAFQAAEYALRECLSSVQDGSYASNPVPAPLTPSGVDAPPVWEVESNWTTDVSLPVTVSGYADSDLAGAPRCLFESLGSGTGSYRITVRALGASDTTAVILQATYSTE